ncbi:hypothetical protein BHM03_00033482 [Ensete ventricosum]|nr:hypothetical protein BHM03_00033482 [Ensete ventricosum]
MLRHRSKTPRLLIIVVATLRYGSRTPGLVVMDAVTARHGSRTPRCCHGRLPVEGASKKEEPTAEGIARCGWLAAAGASAAAVADGEEQQLLQNWWKRVPT